MNCEICCTKTRRIGSQKRSFMAKFPLDEERCKKWVAATGNEDLVYVPIEKLHQLRHVCWRHFRPKDFSKKKTQLRKGAVPCVDISVAPLTDEQLKDFPYHVHKIEITKGPLTDHNYYCSDAKRLSVLHHFPKPTHPSKERFEMWKHRKEVINTSMTN